MANAGRTFVDTNVLVCAHDASEAVRQPMARATLEQLWADGTGTLSTQVLQEFYVVATGKLDVPLSPAEAREVIELYAAWPIVVLGPTLILNAARLHEGGGIAFWDALIVEAARVAGAERLLTEDLADGAVIAGVRIENPFSDSLDRLSE